MKINGVFYGSVNPQVQKTAKNPKKTINAENPINNLRSVYNFSNIPLYQNVVFKGRGIDAQKLKETLKENQNGKTLEITTDKGKIPCTFYPGKHRDYAILNDGIYKVHYSRDDDKIKEQVIASKFYNLMNIRTPECIPFETGDKKGYLTEIFDEVLFEPDQKALYRSFAADAFLGNRNGLSKGNVKIDKNGNVVKTTVSGSLNYRASGKIKESPLATSVNELTTMRQKEINPESAAILSKMSDDDLIEALNNVTQNITDEKIREICSNYAFQAADRHLSTVLMHRLADMKYKAKKTATDKTIKERGYDPDSIGSIDKEYLLKITDESWEKLKERKLLTPSAEIKKFSPLHLASLAQMTDIEHETALKTGLYRPFPWENDIYSKGKTLCGWDIAAFAKADEKTREIIQKDNLMDFASPKHSIVCSSFSDFVLNKLVPLNDEDRQKVIDSRILDTYCDGESLEKFVEILHDDNTEKLYPSFVSRVRQLAKAKEKFEQFHEPYGYDARGVLLLAQLNNDGWKRISSFTQNFNNITQSSGSLYELGQFDDETYDILKKRGMFDNFKSSSGYYAIAALSDEQWENIKKRGLDKRYPDDPESQAQLAELTDEQYQSALDNKLFEPRCNERFVDSLRFMSASDIAKTVKFLEKEDWDNVHKRDLLHKEFNNEYGRTAPVSSDILIELAKLGDDEYEKFETLNQSKGDERIYNESLIDLCKLDDEQFDKIIERNLLKYTDTYEAWDNWTEDAPVIEALSCLTDKEYQMFLDQMNDCKTVKAKILIIKADQLGLRQVNKLSELSFRCKKQYLALLLAYGPLFMTNDFRDNYDCTDIIPKNSGEYVKILNELVKSTGINSKPVDKAQKARFLGALDEISSENSPFKSLDTEKQDFKISLKYELKDFMKDVFEAVKHLPKKERAKIWDYFGFELSNAGDGSLAMSGYPVINNNDKKLGEITNPATREAIEKIKPFVKHFGEENAVIADGRFITSGHAKILNTLLETLSEIYSIIGKTCGNENRYTLDIDTLAVLKNCSEDPEFQNLNKSEQRALLIAALLHNSDKNPDNKATHQQDSAYCAYYITEKLGLSKSERQNIYRLIKHHEIFSDVQSKYNEEGTERFPLNEKQKERKIKEFAFDLRFDNLIESEKILSRSTIKAQQGLKGFESQKDEFEAVFDELKKRSNEINKTAILLPQTRIPKASELKPDGENVVKMTTINKDGTPITNTVVKLKKGLNLEQFGFDKGVNAQNLGLLVHGFDTESQQAILDALGLIDQSALLSTSYIDYEKGNYHTFRPQGFIMNVPSDGIGAGYFRDFGSGFAKTVDNLVKKYIYGSRMPYRKYIPDLIKERFNLTDEQYVEFYKEIKDKSFDELEKEKPEIAKGLKEIFNNMEVKKRSFNRDYNEILVTEHTPCGVFYQGKIDNKRPYTFDDLPIYLKKYAQDNDLAIIYFGE